MLNILRRKRMEDEPQRQETTPEMCIKEVLERRDTKELREMLFRYVGKGEKSFKDELSLVEMVFALVESSDRILKEEGLKSFIDYVEDLKRMLSPENSGIYNMDLLKAVLFIKSFQDRTSAGKEKSYTFSIALSKIYQQFKDSDTSFADKRFLLSLILSSGIHRLRQDKSEAMIAQDDQKDKYEINFYSSLLYLIKVSGVNMEYIKRLIDYEVVAVSKDNRNFGFEEIIRCIERIQVLQDVAKYIIDSDTEKEEFCGYIKGVWKIICLQIQQYLISCQDDSIPPEKLLALERHLRDVNPELSIFLRIQAIDGMRDKLSTDRDIASYTTRVLKISKLYTSVRTVLYAYRFLKESLERVRKKLNEDNNKIYLYRILAEISRLVLEINNSNYASLGEELEIPDNWINEIDIDDLDSVFMALSIFGYRMQNNMVEEGEYRELINKISQVKKLVQEKSYLIDAILALIVYAYNIKGSRN